MKSQKIINNRFNEVIISTSNLSEMKNKYLAERLTRTYYEEFADEDTGEVVSIERNEILFEKGTFISNDILSQINFYMHTKDVTEVSVSNQQRTGIILKNTPSVWQATVKVKNKNRNYLMYADSMILAQNIISDYLEQEVLGGFTIQGIKELEFSNLIQIEDDGDDLEFYKVELAIGYDNQLPFNQSYILKSEDAETAKTSIVHYMMKQEDRKDDFNVTIVSAKKIKCFGIVDYQFSKEYLEQS